MTYPGYAKIFEIFNQLQIFKKMIIFIFERIFIDRYNIEFYARIRTFTTLVLGISEWETGVAIFFRIRPWAQSDEGWHVAFKFAAGLDGNGGRAQNVIENALVPAPRIVGSISQNPARVTARSFSYLALKNIL